MDNVLLNDENSKKKKLKRKKSYERRGAHKQFQQTATLFMAANDEVIGEISPARKPRPHVKKQDQQQSKKQSEPQHQVNKNDPGIDQMGQIILNQLNQSNQNDRYNKNASAQRVNLQNGSKTRSNNTFMLGQQYTFANLPAECSPIEHNSYKLETVLGSNHVYEKDDIQIDDQEYNPNKESESAGGDGLSSSFVQQSSQINL